VKHPIPFVVASFALAIGLGLAIGLPLRAHNRHECAAKGGHLKAVYKSSLCLTPDGRVIE
jgi:hypothetical protein